MRSSTRHKSAYKYTYFYDKAQNQKPYRITLGYQKVIFARENPKSSNTLAPFPLIRRPQKQFSPLSCVTTPQRRKSRPYHGESFVECKIICRNTRLPYHNFDDNNRLHLNDRLSLKKKRKAPNKTQTPRLHCGHITSKVENQIQELLNTDYHSPTDSPHDSATPKSSNLVLFI